MGLPCSPLISSSRTKPCQFSRPTVRFSYVALYTHLERASVCVDAPVRVRRHCAGRSCHTRWRRWRRRRPQADTRQPPRCRRRQPRAAARYARCPWSVRRSPTAAGRRRSPSVPAGACTQTAPSRPPAVMPNTKNILGAAAWAPPFRLRRLSAKPRHRRLYGLKITYDIGQRITRNSRKTKTLTSKTEAKAKAPKTKTRAVGLKICLEAASRRGTTSLLIWRLMFWGLT